MQDTLAWGAIFRQLAIQFSPSLLALAVMFGLSIAYKSSETVWQAVRQHDWHCRPCFGLFLGFHGIFRRRFRLDNHT